MVREISGVDGLFPGSAVWRWIGHGPGPRHVGPDHHPEALEQPVVRSRTRHNVEHVVLDHAGLRRTKDRYRHRRNGKVRPAPDAVKDIAVRPVPPPQIEPARFPVLFPVKRPQQSPPSVPVYARTSTLTAPHSPPPLTSPIPPHLPPPRPPAHPPPHP